MLELRNISFDVPDHSGRKEIIRNINLTIEQNQSDLQYLKFALDEK